MNDYCILVQKNRIAAHRIIGGNIDPIYFGGEAWLELDEFWDLFKRKIEYCESEKIALLVLTNNELFTVDTSIKTADQFSCTKKDLVRIINNINLSDCNVLTYPDIEINSSAIIKKQEKPLSLDSVDIDQNSLQGFFVRKTQEYKRG